MKIQVIDRSDTVGIILDENNRPYPKPENWIVCNSTDIENIPFVREWLTEGGYSHVQLKESRTEWNLIVAYKEGGFKSVIGYWKNINLNIL